jgi:DNA-binding NarL/FixJ family response regulator
MSKIRIVAGDDHPLVQAALANAFAEVSPEIEIVACYNLDEVLSAVAISPADADLVLLDLNMPGTYGFTGLFLMLGHFPTVPVAILSAQHDVTTIRRAMSFGASGFVPKSLSLADMAKAITAILQGERWIPPHAAAPAGTADDPDLELARRFASLSPQQMRILALIVEGKLNKQIAGDLNLAEQTIKIHVSAIFKKLHVSTRTQAAVLAGKLAAQGGAEAGPDKSSAP